MRSESIREIESMKEEEEIGEPLKKIKSGELSWLGGTIFHNLMVQKII